MNNSGKTNGCLIALIVFLIIIILAGAAIFFIFFLNRSDMPDVNEFISEVENSERTTDNNSSITDLINIKPDEGGTTELTITLTNADLTALANDTVDSNDDIPFKDLLLNCNEDDTIDVTGVISDLSSLTENSDIPAIMESILKTIEGKRLYATIYISYLGGSNFDIYITNVMVGKMNIPMVESLLEPMTDDIADMLQDQLDSQENFELQEFNVEENQLSFSGIIAE